MKKKDIIVAQAALIAEYQQRVADLQAALDGLDELCSKQAAGLSLPAACRREWSISDMERWSSLRKPADIVRSTIPNIGFQDACDLSVAIIRAWVGVDDLFPANSTKLDPAKVYNDLQAFTTAAVQRAMEQCKVNDAASPK